MNFLNQYQQAGGNAHLIGGSIMVDQTVLSSKGKAKDALIGTPRQAAWPTPTSPQWQAFVKAYQRCRRRLFQESVRQPIASGDQLLRLGETPCSRRSTRSKANSATATRNSAQRCRASCSTRRTGQIKLDENRQAIGTSFVTEVVKDDKGELVTKLVKIVPNVQQRLGFSKAVYDKFIPPGRDNPPCEKNYN